MSKFTSKRLLSVLLVLAMVLSMVPAALAAESAKADGVVVLYTNDTHCGVDAGNPEGTMGFANLAAYKKAMQAAYNNVVLVDAGDAIQGEAIGTLSNGSYLVDIMNQVGYDYATFGNHEFDYGMDVALSLLTESNAKYLSCNFKDLRTGKTVADAYDLVDYNGLKVAYVGISTPETFTKSTPTYFQDENGNYIYGFCEGNNGQDLYDAVQATVDEARKAGADVVIAVAHLGVDQQSSPWMSREVIANTTGLDAIIDGHSHSTIAGEIVKNKNGEDVVLTSTGTKLANIGKMVIAPDGTISTELVNGYTEVDAETDTFVKNIQSKYEDKLNEVVAKTDVALTVNDPETGKRIIRNQETNLGDLCADAYRNVLGADVAFVNGGGIRANIAAGDITYGQIIAVHPFGNSACVVEATGQQILDALEHTARAYPGENGGFLQVSGLKYTINPYVESSVTLDDKSMFVSVDGPRRVLDVQVLQKDGSYAPIDPNGTYTVASHNYMLKSGGDGINMFMKDKVLQDEVMIDNQVLITYIRDYLGGVVGEAYANPYGQGRISVVAPTDVDENDYAYDPIMYMYENGYMNGTSATTFSPEGTLSRAMVVTVLYRMAGEPEVTGTCPLSDVGTNEYYTKAVTWAYQNGITLGYDDGTFDPNGAVSRAQVMTFLYRYAKNIAGDETTANVTSKLDVFTDGTTVPSYAAKAVLWGVENGIINGYPDGSFRPNDTCQRAQLAAMVYRFFYTTINLMGTSDVHGQMFATDYTADASASGSHYQSLTRVATFVKEQRAKYMNTFMVDCGDLVQGTPLTYYYAFMQPEADDPAMKALRYIGYDMFVPGNHEFNYGMTILQRQLGYLTSDATATESSVAVGCANYLAAETNNDETRDWATWNGYAPYQIYNYGGIKVAVMGIGNPNIAKWDVPANWEGIYFANPIDTYKHYEQELTEKADFIVICSHSGIDSAPEDSDFIRALVEQTNTIDLALTGHEHRNGVTKIANADGKEINVFSLGTKANVVGQAILTVDRFTGEYTISCQNVPMTYRDENRKTQPKYEADKAMVEALQPYETAAWNDYMLKTIGKATGNFSAANLGGAPSAFVELINKVQLWGAYDRTGENTPNDKSDDKQAMLSITAPLTSGNAANLIPEGEIVLGDMFKLYRYENWFYQITMTGKEVDTWLEYSASKVRLNEDGTVSIQGGLTYYDVINGEGFSYTIDPTRESGDRVTLSYNGEAVADDFVFTVVVNNYRYNGGGGYVQYLNEHGCTFVPNDESRVIYSTQYDMIQGEDKGQARNLLADYITEQGTIDPADYADFQWSILGAK